MTSDKKNICIIGGGFGGIFSALNLADAGRVTLISSEDHFLFTPMLYEYFSGEVEAWQIAPSYKELLDDRVKFLRGEVTDIDLHAHRAQIAGDGDHIDYEVLIIAVGSETNYAGVDGAEQYALPFRQLSDAEMLRRRLTDTLDHIPPDLAPESTREALTVAVVGGNASGIELSAKIADLLRAAFERRGLKGEPRVIIVEQHDRVGPEMSADLRSTVEEALKKSGVEVQTGTKVTRVTARSIQIENNKKEEEEIQVAAVVWAGGVKVSPLVEKLRLEKDEKGLVAVEETLQVRGYENVFALGDITHYRNADKELGGTAQLAYQEAGLVADNVRALLDQRPLGTKHFVQLGEALSLGTESAAIEVGGHVFAGALGREARFAAYVARLPTWHQRFRVGPGWILGAGDPRPL